MCLAEGFLSGSLGGMRFLEVSGIPMHYSDFCNKGNS